MNSTFYGWRIVVACMLLATVSWSLGIYGMGVYVYALTDTHGLSVSTVSLGVTIAYGVSGSLMLGVGRFIARRGPRLVVAAGAFAMALAVAAMPHCREPWQVYAAFATLGLGVACLSTNTVGSTLAPWFDRFQGRAMSTAMLGASIGGMVGTPLLLGGMRAWGFPATAVLAAAIVLLVLWPLAALVLRKAPQDVGQLPDGLPAARTEPTDRPVPWTLREAVATRQFRSHALAFGLGLMVQVGFLSHHVSIAAPTLGAQGAAAAVSSAAAAAFLGRLLLARFADQVDIRKVGAGVFVLAAASLGAMALLPGPAALLAMSVSFGLTVGNVTTLAPMIVRREFGAASFGVVFGLAATLNQFSMALGPTVYGVLRDLFGGYGPALLLCGAVDVAAAMAILWGGRRPLPVRSAATGE